MHEQFEDSTFRCLVYRYADLHFDFVGLDALIQRAHIVLWQVTAIVDAAIVAQEVLHVPQQQCCAVIQA